MADDSDAAKTRALAHRVVQLEIACDQLRHAVSRSVDLAMSVAQLVNVQDQRSADMIFRDIKLAIAEIRAMAPVDRPLVVNEKVDE
jgi:hypothetical protein